VGLGAGRGHPLAGRGLGAGRGHPLACGGLGAGRGHALPDALPLVFAE
jgi:hypothetical protein